MRIALISCTSKKKAYKCKTSDMYSESPRFALPYEYAKKTSDRVYILSAKHGLISEGEIIEPYNETLKDKSVEARKEWSKNVLNDLNSKCSLDYDEFLILAGTAYNEYLLPHISKYEMPLKGKRMGEWIPELKRLLCYKSEDVLDEKSLLIHKILNNMPRIHWNEIDKLDFNNGIYVMFETGEKYFGMDRIVRIGTHVADDRLKVRLKNHFIGKNADSSIFRKNIGRAILHNENDPYESVWELDTSNREVREANIARIDLLHEEEIENKVSMYLKDNISFVCFQVNEKSDRLKFEEGLIAALNKSVSFKSSPNWIGLNSSKKEIVNSGLWNVQGLNGNELTQAEINYLKEMIAAGQYIKNHEIKSNDINENKLSKSINLKEKDKSHVKVTTAEIKNYIMDILIKAKENNLTSIEIISGDIHKKMNLVNKMPSVCSAMYQLKKEKDEILHTTESGKSSTIKIRYYLF